MDWPNIPEVVAIRPIQDERKQREWLLKKYKSQKKTKKNEEKEKEQPENTSKKNHKIDIYI